MTFAIFHGGMSPNSQYSNLPREETRKKIILQPLASQERTGGTPNPVRGAICNRYRDIYANIKLELESFRCGAGVISTESRGVLCSNEAPHYLECPGEKTGVIRCTLMLSGVWLGVERDSHSAAPAGRWGAGRRGPIISCSPGKRPVNIFRERTGVGSRGCPVLLPYRCLGAYMSSKTHHFHI